MRLFIGQNVAIYAFASSLFTLTSDEAVTANKTQIGCNHSFQTYHSINNNFSSSSQFLSQYSSPASSTNVNIDNVDNVEAVYKQKESSLGFLKFQASTLPAKIQQVDGSSWGDDYLLSLDVLFPSIPKGYALKINQKGLVKATKFMSKTIPSTVKESGHNMQFDTKKLISIEIEFQIDDEGPPSPVGTTPLTYSMADSPTLSQTIMPEGVSYTGSRLEMHSVKAPSVVGRTNSALFMPSK